MRTTFSFRVAVTFLFVVFGSMACGKGTITGLDGGTDAGAVAYAGIAKVGVIHHGAVLTDPAENKGPYSVETRACCTTTLSVSAPPESSVVAQGDLAPFDDGGVMLNYDPDGGFTAQVCLPVQTAFRYRYQLTFDGGTSYSTDTNFKSEDENGDFWNQVATDSCPKDGG